jgi:multiple sugar transport system substrate-binding protein
VTSSAGSDRSRGRSGPKLSRRQVLRGLVALAGATSLPALVAACASPRASTLEAGASPVPGSELTFGSNQSDPVPRAAIEAVVGAWEARSGVTVRINTVDNSTFQDQMSSYLQGTPDDVFTWFAGDRMRFFAEQGLAGDLSDIWTGLGDRFGPAFREASTASDGRQYFIPFATYPWVVLYRRSVWRAAGYEVPATLEDLVALWERMDADGLVPIAFANREGWPAMGTFDILDLRLNGYDFHAGLLRGRERWTDARVRRVFEVWREVLPYHQVGAAGRTWQEAARSMIAGDAGMYFMGAFAAEQATEEERADLDMFPFPALRTEFDEERAIDAPINGFMRAPAPRNAAAARAFLEYLASGEAQTTFVTRNPSRIATASDADRSGWTPYQRRMAEVIADAGRITQFFDRDTRPDFAGPSGMQSFLADFLAEPGQDLDALLADVQAYWDSLT